MLTEIGCAFKNQMLFPSNDIEGAEINIVELEKQKISAKIPERSEFGIAIPNSDVSPSLPLIPTNTPITSIKTTPITVLMR